MKLLKDILYKVRLTGVIGSTNSSISSIAFDSRKVERNGLFIAVKGGVSDGHQFIDKAIEMGAKAIVCEKMPDNIISGVTYIEVENSGESLGQIASNFYENPSNKLKLVGVTGTNGKTTTTSLLFELFTNLGYKVGLISTVVYRIGEKEIKATHTTPDAIRLNELFAQMVEEKCDFCFMEVSSHAIHQGRINGIDFTGGVFTNITHDHLDYHKTFKEYIDVKKKFFDGLSSDAFAITNLDDKNGMVMMQNTKAEVLTLAIKGDADFKAKIIENQFTGLQLKINDKDLWVKLIGDFNAYNILSVYAVALQLLEDELEVLTQISALNNVEGRFEYMRTTKNIVAIVDYAHTPDALKNVLKTIANIRTGNEKVITVVGCGGDRDKTKRSIMANIACKLSDKVILTSDNPRTENPVTILEEMQKGVEPIDYKKTITITDRKEAIKTASALAEENDIILVAGKGHENYQEINGERFPFDDLEILTETLKILDK
ncbi:MAG: UDP-N-acetylmuramoyl-L-alanyl-D-glutamate--2,6-diaminopimelate ligase [Flavobacteriales bacterium]|jgi:UDP-N-acetylmuramoyl-L-alanyl-D-glutamate--2,6-diaminopimelate ligase|tara:strand:+ start:3541 stop:5004 length:1464 start_codon:yes stop_codon:yes gene_type:complete